MGITLIMPQKKYNRIKRVLKEKKRTAKWLAAELGVDEGTVSRWCRNVQQPGLPTLVRIAEVLGVRVGELLEEESTN